MTNKPITFDPSLLVAKMHVFRGNNSSQIKLFYNLFKTIIGLFTWLNCGAKFSCFVTYQAEIVYGIIIYTFMM